MLCIPHRKNPVEDLEVNIEDLDVNIVDKDPDFVPPPAPTDPSTKEDMDRLLDNSTEDVSPIKFQIQSPVNDISNASLRYHKRKYKEAKAVFKKKFCSLFAPGQAEEFESLVSSKSDNEDSDKSDRITAELQALIDAYDSTDNERHKLMILSVLPPEHYSKQKIMKLFNCSRYKVDASRKWRKTYGALTPKPIQKVYRKKLDISAAKHFINFLFGANLLQDVAFGTTILKYDTGEKRLCHELFLLL